MMIRIMMVVTMVAMPCVCGISSLFTAPQAIDEKEIRGGGKGIFLLLCVVMGIFSPLCISPSVTFRNKTHSLENTSHEKFALQERIKNPELKNQARLVLRP